MRSITLIANPGSGDGKAGEVAAALRSAGAEVTEIPVERAGEAAGAGADVIAVAGGDGSIAPAAAAASAAAVPLAVIAVGTANDFATRMELPLDLGDAVELAVTGEARRPIDLGEAAGRPFVNVTGIGLAPRAAERAEGAKEKLGAAAYAVGAASAAVAEDPVALEVRCDGEVLYSGDSWQAMVACTGAFGGGSQLDADPGDGLLDVVVIEASSRARLPQRALGLRLGRLEEQDGVHTGRCVAVEVSLPEGEPVNLDGEVVELDRDGGALRFGVRAAAFELLTG